mmetsp:Transcript_11301/g.42334  ORF Transcript_11301/g.42334 Transcript_11301/m.42334 type:complete len:760 (-) Transcript_11301:644-2923(-)|eukprot:CAMPEP_0117439384 /NCGR_PEP_ID=MMETSP0759-20121206/2538_1 /TAXON_ID=63605 /ORGANISM="Percolomonas cosmopolitus, Strain WS" /LENGTH=759 /DNA_ID=CAMNT_0005231099 /DNA_START=212 /DNA_END=2491 /DNA_ORIENTATION=+
MPSISQKSKHYLSQFIEDSALEYECIVSVQPLNQLILRELSIDKSVEEHRKNLHAKINRFTDRADEFVSALFKKISARDWFGEGNSNSPTRSSPNHPVRSSSSQSVRYTDSPEQKDRHRRRSTHEDNRHQQRYNDRYAHEGRKRKFSPTTFDENDGRKRKMRKYSDRDGERHSRNTSRGHSPRRSTPPERREYRERGSRRNLPPQHRPHQDNNFEGSMRDSHRRPRVSDSRDSAAQSNRQKNYSVSPSRVEDSHRIRGTPAHAPRNDRAPSGELNKRFRDDHRPPKAEHSSNRNNDDSRNGEGYRSIQVFAPPKSDLPMYERYEARQSEDMHRAFALAAATADEGSCRIPLVLNARSQSLKQESSGGNRHRTHHDSPFTLRVQKVPEEFNTEDQMRQYFSQFGPIVSVRCMLKLATAVVEFESKGAGMDALHSSEAVFGNRFITLKALPPRDRRNAPPPPHGADLHFQSTTDGPAPPAQNGDLSFDASHSLSAPTHEGTHFVATPSGEQLATMREGYTPPTRLDLRTQQRTQILKDKHASLLRRSQTLIKEFKNTPKGNIEQRGKIAEQLKKVKEVMTRVQNHLEMTVNSITTTTDHNQNAASTAGTGTSQHNTMSQVSFTANGSRSQSSSHTTSTTPSARAHVGTEGSASMAPSSTPLMTTCIYVRNFPTTKDEDSIRRHFSQFGTISTLKLVDNGAYVKFSNRHEADEAKTKGACYETSQLNVEWSQIPENASLDIENTIENEPSDMDDDDDLNFRR